VLFLLFAFYFILFYYLFFFVFLTWFVIYNGWCVVFLHLQNNINCGIFAGCASAWHVVIHVFVLYCIYYDLIVFIKKQMAPLFSQSSLHMKYSDDIKKQYLMLPNKTFLPIKIKKLLLFTNLNGLFVNNTFFHVTILNERLNL